jgi:hypothetical protein
VPARQIRERAFHRIWPKAAAHCLVELPFERIMRRLADFQSNDVEAFCDRWG